MESQVRDQRKIITGGVMWWCRKHILKASERERECERARGQVDKGNM